MHWVGRISFVMKMSNNDFLDVKFAARWQVVLEGRQVVIRSGQQIGFGEVIDTFQPYQRFEGAFGADRERSERELWHMEQRTNLLSPCCRF